MLTVTDDALDHLSELLQNPQVPDEAALRITAGEQGLALVLDTPQPGDAAIEKDGRTLLVMEESISAILDERTLDIESTEGGAQLALK